MGQALQMHTRGLITSLEGHRTTKPMVAVQPPPHCGPARSIRSVVVGLLRTPQIEDLVVVAQRSGIVICWWYHCVTAKHITSYLFTTLSMAVSPPWNGWGRGSKRALTGPPGVHAGGHMLCFPVNLHPSSCIDGMHQMVHAAVVSWRCLCMALLAALDRHRSPAKHSSLNPASGDTTALAVLLGSAAVAACRRTAKLLIRPLVLCFMLAWTSKLEMVISTTTIAPPKIGWLSDRKDPSNEITLEAELKTRCIHYRTVF